MAAAGAARIERQELRTNRALAERVEAADKKDGVRGAAGGTLQDNGGILAQSCLPRKERDDSCQLWSCLPRKGRDDNSQRVLSPILHQYPHQYPRHILATQECPDSPASRATPRQLGTAGIGLRFRRPKRQTKRCEQ